MRRSAMHWSSRIADQRGASGIIARNDAVGAHDAVLTKLRITEDYRAGPDPHPFLEHDRVVNVSDFMRLPVFRIDIAALSDNHRAGAEVTVVSNLYGAGPV